MSELRPLNYLELEGYKTFRSLPKFALRNGLNVLIGANGSGKTNLIRFFEMLGVMMDPNLSLQNYLPWQGGANGLLFRGLQVTQEMRARLWFNLNEYRFTLRAGPQGVLFFSDENVHFNGPNYGAKDYPQGQGHVESALPKKQVKTSAEQWTVNTLSNWRVFHFHNTAPLAPVMQPVNMVDNERLRGDAGNLAAFLWRMRETRRDYYDRIVAHIRLAAPYFGEFDFREVAPGQTQLLWKERYSDSVYYPWVLGTLERV